MKSSCARRRAVMIMAALVSAAFVQVAGQNPARFHENGVDFTDTLRTQFPTTIADRKDSKGDASVIARYTADVLDAPDRVFKVTHTSRTHTQVLLQSDAAPDAGHPLRLEILFHTVQFMCMPFVIRGLSLRATTAAERDRLAAAHDLNYDQDYGFYRLSPEHDWFIVSGRPHWAEARLAYHDEPVFWGNAHNEDVIVSLGSLS